MWKWCSMIAWVRLELPKIQEIKRTIENLVYFVLVRLLLEQVALDLCSFTRQTKAFPISISSHK